MKTTKLKNDTEVTESTMLSYENVSQNKEIFKYTTGFETNDFLAVFEFLDTSSRCENIKLYQTRSLKVILKTLNLEKRQSS